jgi:hypothetical protein
MKILPFPFIALTLGLLLSCSSSNQITSSQHPEILKQYEVGDTAHGGIVFLINSDGTHGLVAALQDQIINSDYHESVEEINDPRFHDQYGKQYFDWRLPKLWEAYKMYMNLHLVNMGGFSASGYWTCHQANSYEKMQVLSFAKGIDFASLKTDTYRARAVRSF